MDALERLIATEEIKQLEAKRVQFLDLKDWDGYAALHVPEINHTYGGGPPAFGLVAVMEKLRNRLGDALTIHHLHSPEIEFIDAHTAKAVWAMEDTVVWDRAAPDKWMHGFGHYYCDYVSRDGRWLICGRVLKRLWVREGDGALTAALM